MVFHRAPLHGSIFSRLVLVSSLVAVGTFAMPAWAGDIEVGSEPLETDDQGRLTAESKQATVEEVENVPGENAWEIHLWANLDRGAPGPLYVQFWDKYQGKDIKVPWAYEDSSYDGGEFATLDFTIEDNVGFNKDHTYRIKIVQFDQGKEILLAQGAKVKLLYTREEAEAPASGSKEAGTSEASEASAQDIADSFGGTKESADDGNADGPPEVGSPAQKRGCTVNPEPWLGISSLAMMMLLGAGLSRRD